MEWWIHLPLTIILSRSQNNLYLRPDYQWSNRSKMSALQAYTLFKNMRYRELTNWYRYSSIYWAKKWYKSKKWGLEYTNWRWIKSKKSIKFYCTKKHCHVSDKLKAPNMILCCTGDAQSVSLSNGSRRRTQIYSINRARRYGYVSRIREIGFTSSWKSNWFNFECNYIKHWPW